MKEKNKNIQRSVIKEVLNVFNHKNQEKKRRETLVKNIVIQHIYKLGAKANHYPQYAFVSKSNTNQGACQQLSENLQAFGKNLRNLIKCNTVQGKYMDTRQVRKQNENNTQRSNKMSHVNLGTIESSIYKSEQQRFKKKQIQSEEQKQLTSFNNVMQSKVYYKQLKQSGEIINYGYSQHSQNSQQEIKTSDLPPISRIPRIQQKYKQIQQLRIQSKVQKVNEISAEFLPLDTTYKK